jgi:UrcA family protein
MTKTLLNALAASALAAAAATLAPVAVAGETAALSYSDLDLSTEAGKAELSKRIDATARKACSTEPATGTRIKSQAGMEECMADVRRQVETRLASQANRNALGR